MAGNDEKTNSIEIPSSLFDRVEKRLPKTDFSSVSDYVSYLVREVLNSIEEDETKAKPFTDEEEKEIEERLRNLGYID